VHLPAAPLPLVSTPPPMALAVVQQQIAAAIAARADDEACCPAPLGGSLIVVERGAIQPRAVARTTGYQQVGDGHTACAASIQLG